MTFAARAARFVIVGLFAATLSLSSVGGLAGPQLALAASSQSAKSVESARTVPLQSVRASASTQSSAAASRTPQAKPHESQRALIVRLAESHVGAHYRFGATGGATGMNPFDCSGLVFRVFKDAGLIDKIGGNRKGAKGYLHWFRERGLASKTNPKPGDLVIWNNGHHIGIYVGNGMAVSALNKHYGVREHGIGFVHTFTTYLHVQIRGRAPNSNPGPGLPSTVKVTAGHAVVRDGPSQTHHRVGNLTHGKTVTVTDKSQDAKGRTWFKVKLQNGTIGWVLSNRVTAI